MLGRAGHRARATIGAARVLRLAALALACATLPGCVARTAYNVVTAPVRVAGKAVDLATTSQSEADEKRGRELRRREERLNELNRSYRRHSQDCQRGDSAGCARAQTEYAEIQRLLPTVPAEPR